ncbi:disulfide bond formation protein B [Candidatus Woesearchaeota archaeon]|nr:disulfide bond formation protein B [Candidatus Woesearchaeota archaeon]
MIEAIENFIPTLAAFTHIVIVLTLFGLITIDIREKIIRTFIKHKNLLVMILSIAAISGSLFYSEIVGLIPCRLCWYQRIAIFPLSVLSIIAFVTKDKKPDRYILPLAAIGAFISAYHYVTQFFVVSTSCIVGEANCADKLFMHYGYITIPLMAFTICISIILIYAISRMSKK